MTARRRGPDLFNWAMRYPRVPGSKARDTSRQAAADIEPKAQTIRDQVYERIKAAGADGLTADEVAMALDISILNVRPRVSELGRMRLIVDGGARRENYSKKMAIVWRVPC